VAAAVTVCARCGSEVPAGARFCPSCGATQGDLPREERRFVTVLFGDLTGFTELSERRDAEEVKRIVDGVFERVTAIVESYGGRIDKVIGDEVMAVFGAPQAYEDDPERAVRAAMAIQRTMEEYSADTEAERGVPVRMHIGINTGEVVAGLVGGADAYTVIGDAVNTARRIEEEARAGQILVGEATHEASRTAIEYRRLGQVSVKGKSRPVVVFEAVGERALPGQRVARPSPLIGRDEELGLLDTFARIARRDGKPQAVVIIGEAGMGKSRVVAEFAQRLASEGGRVLHGRSLPYGTTSPAFAVEELVRAALLLDSSLHAEHAERWAREHIEELGLTAEADRLIALLGLGEASPSREPTSTGPAATSAPLAGGATAWLDAARTLFERVAEREGFLALAFHELHWAEDAVLDLVQALLRITHAPLLVISLARPVLLERRPVWSRSLGTTLLSLEPLPRDRAAELLAALAPSLSPRLRENVLDRAGGNPFYLQELARLLTDGEVEPSAVPVSVQALVSARLDAVPPARKLLLQHAAVVGEEFSVEGLAALAGIDPVEVGQALGELVEAGFVEPVSSPSVPGSAAYRFAQTLVREVAYASVPKHLRAQQHDAVARWLEQRAADAERDLSDLIAYHYERTAQLAGEVGAAMPDALQRAREALEHAGDHALELDAAAAAADLYERALAFASEDDPASLTLRLHLGEALLAIWKDAAAEEHLVAALTDARRLGERAVEAKALRLLGDLYRMRGQVERAREPLERALAIAKEVGDAREEAEGLRSHGLLDLHRGRWSSAALWFRQALARYRHPMLADPRGEGWSLQNLGWASLLLGRYDEAVQYLREGEEVFGALEDVEGAGWCMSLRSWVLLMSGDLAEAEAIAAMLEDVLSVERPDGGSFELDAQRIMRAAVAALHGRFADAEAFASTALAGAQRNRSAWMRGLASYPRFYVAMHRRRFADARVALEDGARAAAATGDPLYVGQFEFARAWLALEEGHPETVGPTVEGFAELGGYQEPEGAGVRWLLARAYAAMGKRAEARALLERSVGRQSIVLIGPAMARAQLAELMIVDGEPAGAVEVARAAVEEAGQDVIARVAALRTLATAALAAGDAAEAERAAREEIMLLEQTDHQVERVRALSLLAGALDAQRRYDEAAETFDQARAALAALPPATDTTDLVELLGSSTN